MAHWPDLFYFESMTNPLDHLVRRRAMAESDVAEARRIVERQRKIVATHRRRRVHSGDAESLLAIFEKNLETFEHNLADIIKEQQDK